MVSKNVLTLCSFLFSFSLFAQDVDYKLVARFTFDGGTFADLTGKNIEATGFSAQFTSDRFGKQNSAIYFSGKSYLTLNNTFDFPEKSINYWFKADNVLSDGTFYQLMATDCPSLKFSNMGNLIKEINGEKKVAFSMNGNNFLYGSIKAAEWNMVSLTQSLTTVKFYFNGELIYTGNNLGRVLSLEGSDNTFVGTTRLINEGFYKGAIDDIRVYNRAITDCEVKSLYLGLDASAKIDLGKDVLSCRDTSLVLDAGAGFLKYEWSTGASSQSIKTNGFGNFWVKVTNKYLCQSTDAVAITKIQPPVVDLGKDITICSNSSVKLKSNVLADVYSWSTGSKANEIEVNKEGKYWLKATNNPSCSATDTISVFFSKLSVRFPSDTSICEGNDLVLTAPADAVTKLWSNSSTQQSITIQNSGKYWLRATDKLGCEFSDTILVSRHLNQLAPRTIDTTAFVGQYVVVQTRSGMASYLWSNKATTAEIELSEPGTYLLLAKDKFGCSVTDTVNIHFDDLIPDVWVPNIFTPNHDYKNDKVKVMGSNIIELRFSIYNRWGAKLFESSDQNEYWDGTFRGKDVSSGTYFYIVYIKLINRRVLNLNGSITLVR